MPSEPSESGIERSRPTTTCEVCGEAIVPGERRSPTSSGIAHDRCQVIDSFDVEWDGDVMRVGDRRRARSFWAWWNSSADDLPDWMVEAANRGLLTEGKVGEIEERKDGSWVFVPTRRGDS